MALLARYFTLTKVKDDEWYVKGTFEREMEGVRQLMLAENPGRLNIQYSTYSNLLIELPATPV